MSEPEQPYGPGPGAVPSDGFAYAPLPLLKTDPPKIGDFWLDSRLTANPAGVAFVGHADDNTPVMVLLLSEGAAADPAARDRFAGTINKLHIDTVVARGGEGQDDGRLGRKFRTEEDDPVEPDDAPLAPWAALLFDGSAGATAEAARILDEVDLGRLGQQGSPSGPDYRLHWAEQTRPGLSRLWPLPWPGRYDRAGWMTTLFSWLLMLLITAVALVAVILLFQDKPPAPPPPPVSNTATPPPSSGGSPPPSGSPSGTPSGSPSGSPSSASASPSSASASPSSASASPSQSASQSGSPSGSPSASAGQTPSGSQSASQAGTGSPTATASAGSPTPNSKL